MNMRKNIQFLNLETTTTILVPMIIALSALTSDGCAKTRLMELLFKDSQLKLEIATTQCLPGGIKSLKM